MGSLNLMTTIVDRKILNRYMELYQDNDLHVAFLSLGYGTASNEILDYLGLESNQKAVSFSIVEEKTWLTVKRQLEKKLKIDAPGGGIAFTIPLSSIGGMKQLQFLLETQEYQKEEETTLKNTDHHLIIVITEPGYTNMVMDAARSAGAYGGTVIHAKGTGMELAEKFMGVSLASEKELVLIVTQTELKNPIMQAIMKDAGLQTKAKSIAFSLPVTDTAGLRLVED
ncbi:MAG: P-II family nitrogen regulator [Lachnospiraceae bacterium]|nr:P-II family nitrogen regulator [Lachnospiraceae bacterium]MBQ2250445.1 P-II family nitrogen regulator [Lachnospiraceae bacterium]MBQ2402100.1 P-II family nitrogen regulator [Lachnospiraceae bacterium]MBQ2425663.1 P-II family nitrogen regulator [Lachnospiraceae bacterium]MBQ5698560.1 P-II family nitrogen regulator [Lachnospiraceae bacterium]